MLRNGLSPSVYALLRKSFLGGGAATALASRGPSFIFSSRGLTTYFNILVYTDSAKAYGAGEEFAESPPMLRAAPAVISHRGSKWLCPMAGIM